MLLKEVDDGDCGFRSNVCRPCVCKIYRQHRLTMKRESGERKHCQELFWGGSGESCWWEEGVYIWWLEWGCSHPPSGIEFEEYFFEIAESEVRDGGLYSSGEGWVECYGGALKTA